MSIEPQRFFFVHVQKSAGTSLIFRLRREFGRAAMYPPESDKGDVASVISVDHLLERWQTDRDTTRVVTGHFPLCTAELLAAGSRPSRSCGNRSNARCRTSVITADDARGLPIVRSRRSTTIRFASTA